MSKIVGLQFSKKVVAPKEGKTPGKDAKTPKEGKTPGKDE